MQTSKTKRLGIIHIFSFSMPLFTPFETAKKTIKKTKLKHSTALLRSFDKSVLNCSPAAFVSDKSGEKLR